MSLEVAPQVAPASGAGFWQLFTFSHGIPLPSATAAGNYAHEGFNQGFTATPFVNVTDSRFFTIVAADLAVAGRTTNFKTRLSVFTNATQPLITFTAGLSLLSASAGGANASSITLAAQVAGTTAAVASPPASTPGTGSARAESSAFAVPADGVYVLTVTTSATMTTNAKAVCVPELFIKHV